MTLLGIIAVLTLSGWIVVTASRRFERHQYPLAWRVAYVVLGLAGLALGLWLLTREHLASPTARLVGYPFAVGGYEFIEGRWLGGGSRLALLACIANIAAGTGICLLPLRIAQFIFERRVARETPGNPA